MDCKGIENNFYTLTGQWYNNAPISLLVGIQFLTIKPKYSPLLLYRHKLKPEEKRSTKKWQWNVVM